MSEHPQPADHDQRDKFVCNWAQNYSVVAPAGVGKTTAIVARLLTIAKEDRSMADSVLERMVVVTYTNKAAEELRRRTRTELHEARLPAGSMERLDRAFFGTLHSYCMEILLRHGHAIGLPAGAAISNGRRAREVLWSAFRRDRDTMITGLAPDAAQRVRRHIGPEAVETLGRDMRLGTFVAPAELPPCPTLDTASVLDFSPDKRNTSNINAAKDMLRHWLRDWEQEDGLLPLPKYKKGGKAFQEAWNALWQPLREWLALAVSVSAAALAREYRAFRIRNGQLTYDDVVDLADALMRLPEVADAVRENRPSILLDEAQDTDPVQFRVLLEAARAPGMEGLWITGQGDPPEQGRFSMVGDPQQSIYGSRADLRTYEDIRERLESSGAAESLKFTVTFRCPQSVINNTNKLFPTLLDGADGQVDYVALCAKEGAPAGSVVRVPFARPADLPEKASSGITDRVFAELFADWLLAHTPESLGTDDWKQVAVLCPRRSWLSSLDGVLQNRGLSTQLHSASTTWRDVPAYAWLTALLTAASAPNNAFEIAGVLRDIYCISDHDIAEYCAGAERDSEGTVKRRTLQMARPVQAKSVVADVLNELAGIRADIVNRPLREAVVRLVADTDLRQRLAVLAECNVCPAGEQQEVLDCLILRATQAENNRLTLGEWAAELRDGLSDSPAENEAEAGCIQLLTYHKAKGLEWDVVLLPFLFHGMMDTHGSASPRILSTSEQTDLSVPLSEVILTSDQRTDAQKKNRNRVVRQELQRQLYVAFTRAKQRLYLFDDGAISAQVSGAPARALGIEEEAANADWWTALNEADDSVATRTGDGAPEVEASAMSATAWDALKMTAGAGRAREFPRRKLPSSLGDHGPVKTETHDTDGLKEAGHGNDFPDEAIEQMARMAGGVDLAEAARQGANYGNWWHETMETAPWEDGAEACRTYCENRLGLCPDRVRGARELDVLAEGELFARLAGGRCRIRTEVPMLWKQDGSAVFEGIVDMVVKDGDAFTVLDWKTDRVDGGDAADALRGRYGPQVGIYRDALADVFGGTVKACLYSTHLGAVIEL